jgi:hypothetical protein
LYLRKKLTMNRISLPRVAALSVALSSLALAACSNDSSMTAGLSGSPIPVASAEVATTSSPGAHNHHYACAGGIQCERAAETGFGPTP